MHPLLKAISIGLGCPARASTEPLERLQNDHGAPAVILNYYP